MKKFLFILTALLLSVMAGGATEVLTGSFAHGFATVAGLNALAVFVPAMPGILYQLVFTAPGGAGVAFTFNQSQLPQFLIWNDGAVLLTSLRVETAEDGILLDLPAAAIAGVDGFGFVGALPANSHVIRLANGSIRGRNVTISGVTSGAGAVPFFISSDRKGEGIFKYNNGAIQAADRQEYKDFTAVFVPALANGETAEVHYSSGEVSVFDPRELAALSGMYQNVPGIIVNNMNAYIHKVIFTTGAARAATIMSVKAV